MSNQGADDGEQPHIACGGRQYRYDNDTEERIDQLIKLFRALPDMRINEYTLMELQKWAPGVPPDAVDDFGFLHEACQHEGVTLEMIQFLLDAFPGLARSIDTEGKTPLHYACENNFTDPRIVRLLIDRWPQAVNRVAPGSRLHGLGGRGLPLHCLCGSSVDELEYARVDQTFLLAILDMLLNAAPLSATLVDGDGNLPIHLACQSGKPLPFCKRLIDAHPESLKVESGRYGGLLPIHHVCRGEYYFEALKIRGGYELCPERIDASRQDKKEMIRHLLTKDPDCVSKKTGRKQQLMLHFACERECLISARVLFDAYPEAINIRDGGYEAINVRRVGGNTPLDVARGQGHGDALVEFLGAQLVYANLAEDSRAMRTQDEYGWLPLHRALRGGACLGAIKLLCRANPAAVQVPDILSSFPLHMACQFCTVDVVQYLLERSAVAVLEPNSSGKLPIHYLLWESDRVDRNSLEYVDVVWRLLLAHPETVTPTVSIENEDKIIGRRHLEAENAVLKEDNAALRQRNEQLMLTIEELRSDKRSRKD